MINNGTGNVSTLSLRQKAKPAARHDAAKPTHDIILGAIKKQGKPVTLELMPEGSVSGHITQFDKWTITIKDPLDKLITVYKHAIAMFYVED